MAKSKKAKKAKQGNTGNNQNTLNKRLYTINLQYTIFMKEVKYGKG